MTTGSTTVRRICVCYRTPVSTSSCICVVASIGLEEIRGHNSGVHGVSESKDSTNSADGVTGESGDAVFVNRVSQDGQVSYVLVVAFHSSRKRNRPDVLQGAVLY
jgi:hypothetical protein